MGTIKDRNGKDVKEAEEIKKRWKEHKDLYKNGLNDLDNHNSVVNNLELDMLECEVNRALGRITRSKDSEDDGIPAELLQILKDDAVKLLHSICQKIWKTQQWPKNWIRSVFISIPKKDNAKECQTTIPLH